MRRQQVLTGKFRYVKRRDKKQPERRKGWQWQCEYTEGETTVVAAVHDDSFIEPNDSEIEYDFIEVDCLHESPDGRFRLIMVDIIGIHEDEDEDDNDGYDERDEYDDEDTRRALDRAERLC